MAPSPGQGCCLSRPQTFRMYGLFDIGNASTKSPRQSFEPSDETLYSAGFGFRWNFSDRANLRFDYAYGFEDTVFYDEGGRVHVGLSDCSGRDPEPTEVRAVAEVVNGFRGVTLPDETLDEFRYVAISRTCRNS